MATIVRPLRGRVQVRLPFQAGPGNYNLLRKICGEQTHPQYNRAGKHFEVARTHLNTLIQQLPRELGQPVQVVLHGSAQTKCVERCWTAKPETAWECVCSCAGRYHGSQTGPPKHVADGLAVATEYTTETYTVYP